MAYVKIPILDAAERCGISINPRTKEHTEVEAYCPFCNGSSNHLFLNTDSDKFYCQKCGARGNSVSLYARIMGVDNKTAFEQLSAGKVYKLPQAKAKSSEGEGILAPLAVRHDVYYDMLSLMELSDEHRKNLLNRGLSAKRIEENQNTTPLDCNSMYIVDDEKQRAKMAQEFYTSVKKDIEAYEEHARYLINTGSQSPAIMNRWVLKIDALDVKKRQYEEILQRELGELNDEFATLRMFSQELQVRSRRIEMDKAA